MSLLLGFSGCVVRVPQILVLALILMPEDQVPLFSLLVFSLCVFSPPPPPEPPP